MRSWSRIIRLKWLRSCKQQLVQILGDWRENIRADRRFDRSLFSFSFGFALSFSFESLRPRPMVHHLSFSLDLTFRVAGAGSSFFLGSFSFSFSTSPVFVTSPKAPQRRPSRPALDFFFFTTTISPISGSSVGSTNMSKLLPVEEETPNLLVTSLKS